jgi:protein-tyrosine phosphatase
MVRIMFVCHGNICRSTMAEFVMKELVRRAGAEDRYLIASRACRTDEIGNDIHMGTKRKLQAMGIPFGPHEARQIRREDYGGWDYIIGMDSENMRDLQQLFPVDGEQKQHRLLDFAGEHRDVADPWYTGNFDKTYEDILAGCQGLLRQCP